MAHAFDTGLSRPQRTLIRDGAITLLSGLARANGGYLEAVLPWGGIVRGYTDEVGIDLIRSLFNGRAPAIAVAVGDGASGAAGMGGYNFDKTIELVVYFYANHARSLTAGRMSSDVVALASDAADPGLDVMLEHAEELLIGQRIGGTAATNPVGEIVRSTLTIKQIRAVAEEELATENGFTLWRQRYSVLVTRSINSKRGVTQLLEEIRSIVRPSDVPGNVVPDPAEPGDQVLEVQNTIPPPTP